MRRFLTMWLAIVAFAVLLLGVAWLASQLAVMVARYSRPWVGVSVMLLVVSALTAGWMMWAFGPTPPWFQKLVARLSER